MPILKLPHGLAFVDLYSAEGAARIDAWFVAHLQAVDATLAARLAAARADPAALDRRGESELLIALGPHLEDYLAALFGIEDVVRTLEARHHELAPLYAVKRLFVQRKAMNTYRADVATTFDGPALRRDLERALGAPFTELGFAAAVTRWQRDEATNAGALDTALRYAAWASHSAEGRAAHRGGVLFRAPRKLDYMKLVPIEHTGANGVDAWQLAGGHVRRREGFALTDPGMDLVRALDQSHYCIWCHEQGKDSCARGLFEKKPAGAPAPDNPFKKSPFGVTLAGCPLEEKISEFHKLRAEGWPLAALAIICVDNPLVAGTGHRICNDCMKSCIYQKTDPVDIPQAETRILKDILALPWGFEVYSLLTRWNPLDLRRTMPRAATGKRALVVGMGPAGFTLAHHLLNDGHTGGRHRRSQDRAAAAVAVGCRGQRRARAVRARVRRNDIERAARRSRDGRIRRRRRVRDHGALGQELPQGHPAAARAPRPLRASRRRALRRYARRRGRLCARLRSRRRRRGRRQADRAGAAERPRQRCAHRIRLPDGAAVDRRGQGGLRSPTCRSACRSWSSAAG